MTTTRTESSIRSHMERLRLPELRAIVHGRNLAVWTERAIEVAAEVLREREASAGPGRPFVEEGACVRCGEATIPGWVALGSSLLSFLLVGLSWSVLRLVRADGPPIPLLRQGAGASGTYCPACGTVTIEGTG